MFGNSYIIHSNNGTTFELPENSTILDALLKFPLEFRQRIVGVKVNNELVSLNTKIKKDINLYFFDKNDNDGCKMYQSGLKLVLEYASKNLFGDDFKYIFNHSILKGIHLSIVGKRIMTDSEFNELKNEMRKIINQNMPIERVNISSKDVFDFYMKAGHYEKAYNVHNISNLYVGLYKLGSHFNYFYSHMPDYTGCLTEFDLIKIDKDSLVIMYDDIKEFEDPSYVHYEKVIDCFKDVTKWLNLKKIPYVCDINDHVMNSTIGDLIHMCEVDYDNRINDAANEIIKRKAKFILLGGPSSSGKTTTTKKLALNLEAHGFDTITISVDDYFKNRVDTPKHEDGSYDFECLEALDIDLLNKDLNDLIKGREVNLPVFNFITGEREYKDSIVKLQENGIVLIEGLHCLNKKLTAQIQEDLKYTIYLSPFMSIKIDKHNYISTTDLRLIRRIVRDNRSRGYSAAATIASWQSVRDGENKYIFPYLNNADLIINTALAYELGVLKVFAEPLLYSVDNTSPHYEEARRLINFLKLYFTISSECVSYDSVLREFIGGSNFER